MAAEQETRADLLSWVGKYAALAVGLAVATAMFVISAFMNFRFGMTLGAQSFDQWLYGFASLTADGFKALLPFLVIALWSGGKRLLSAAALAIWALCVAWSLASAMGFATTTREVSAASREATNETRDALRERAARLETQIGLLPSHRPAGAVRGAIANADVPREIWNRTRQCADVTLPESLAACAEVLRLRQELAVAEDAARLEAALGETRRALSSVSVVGPSADPQAETIAGLVGAEPGRVQTGLALLITLLIEAGSSLGFTLVVLGASHLKVMRRPWTDRGERKRRRAQMAELEGQEFDAALGERRVAVAEKKAEAERRLHEIASETRAAKNRASAQANAAADPPALEAPETPVALPAPPLMIEDQSAAANKELSPEDVAAAEQREFNQDLPDHRPEDESQDPLGDAVARGGANVLGFKKPHASQGSRLADALEENRARRAGESEPDQGGETG
ncbi:MAG: hypothetical protein AAF909_15775 [Pseudomonadota bacterium]